MSKQLADAFAWIKLIDTDTGKVIPSGSTIETPAKLILRWVVANDSKVDTGLFYVVGQLKRNGVIVKPNGKPNVIPLQTISVPKGQLWIFEFPIEETSGITVYSATLLADLGSLIGSGKIDEESEANNVAEYKWNVVTPPN